MTLHATRDGQKITVHGNNGVAMEVSDSRVTGVHITEEAQHVGAYFLEQLGRLVDEARAEREQVT